MASKTYEWEGGITSFEAVLNSGYPGDGDGLSTRKPLSFVTKKQRAKEVERE